MSEKFHNAYHFIPRPEPAVQPAFPTAKGFGRTVETAHLGHAVYADGTRSGIIRCIITLEQATVIGGEQRPEEGTAKGHFRVVEPYLFGGQPAVPASAIKGLIGGLIETITASPYRILDTSKNLTVSYNEGPPDYRSRRKKGSDLGSILAFCPDKLNPRLYLGVAGLMLGFVADEKQDEAHLQALAGRLRFTRATMRESGRTPFLPDGDFPGESYGGKGYHRLKELAQPMPDYPKKGEDGKDKGGSASGENPTHRSATPNFYMERKGAAGEFIAKKAFAANPREYRVRGAKAYLHHAASTEPDKQPWLSRTRLEDDRKGAWNPRKNTPGEPSAQRKAVVRPLAPGTQFAFEIRFDNLTEAEFNALCFAIQPSPKFRHKIGMGKPLGLGSIHIEPEEVIFVDRAKRYREDSPFAASPQNDARNLNGFDNAVASQRVAMESSERLSTLTALLAIGESHDWGEGQAKGRGLKAPVLWVPLTDAKFMRRWEASAEDESFAWFAQNEKEGQPLPPITGETLPILLTSDPQRKQGHGRQSQNGGNAKYRRPTGRNARRGPTPAPPSVPQAPRYQAIILPQENAHGLLEVAFQRNGQHATAAISRNGRQSLNLKPGVTISFTVEESRKLPGTLLARDIARIL